MTYTSEFPIINSTVDVVVFSSDGQEVLLIQRGAEPFKGKLALPGGFHNPDETLPEAAARELGEETGIFLDPVVLSPMTAVYKPGRDPRGPVISHPFWVRLLKREEDEMPAVAGDDAAAVKWLEWAEIKASGDLAFDHAEILGRALEPMLLEKRQDLNLWPFDR